eukprot:849700-Prorocentrum_minimum.AAC.2
MKFGKNLKDMIEESNPEFADKFLSYKQLKKVLKSIPVAAGDVTRLPGEPSPSPEEDSILKNKLIAEQQSGFVTMLNEELQKFNDFYMEKEEEYVMELQNMEDELGRLASETPEELSQIRMRLVKFHGRLVLLQNWASLNYSALVKILKKHDKSSVLALRIPFLHNVLTQPFYSVEILRDLVSRSEELYRTIEEKQKAINSKEKSSTKCPNSAGMSEPALIALNVTLDDLLTDVNDIDPTIVRQTQIALAMWVKVKSLSIPVPDPQPPGQKRASPDSSPSQTGQTPKKQKLGNPASPECANSSL